MELAFGAAYIAEGIGILIILIGVLFGNRKEALAIGPVSLAVKSPRLAKLGLLVLGIGSLIHGALILSALGR